MTTETAFTIQVDDIEPEDAEPNGLPDTWETFHGLSGGTAGTDTDKDGISDFFELLTGGDPNSGLSPGGGVVSLQPAPAPGDFEYSWRYLNGFELGDDYHLQGSDSLTAWPDLAEGFDYEVISDVSDGPGYRRMTVRLTLAGQKRFLRLSSTASQP